MNASGCLVEAMSPGPDDPWAGIALAVIQRDLPGIQHFAAQKALESKDVSLGNASRIARPRDVNVVDQSVLPARARLAGAVNGRFGVSACDPCGPRVLPDGEFVRLDVAFA